ncbi:hypothetical protein [Leisingera daeponensis]|uniref:hypothetical protein n=1 Tax=Leisingera daeponensis TaxID=405746 RepID=UPI001C966FEE|nr:hypothetical protein [Leisingera daeponensis]MBY6059776.1 hypothetical protein [Leisingera daeponensis]
MDTIKKAEKMTVSKKWVIKFDNGALLAERKMKLTFFLTDAMKFDSKTAADFFLKLHCQEICGIGINPSVGEYVPIETGLIKEMEHETH